MGKSKLNKQLLKEELKKFKLLSEYSFYISDDDEYDKDAENLILGEVGEDGEEDSPLDNQEDGSTDNGDDTPPQVPNDMPQDTFNQDDENGEDDMALAPDDEEIPLAPEENTEDEVELDVTDLVQGNEDVKASTDAMSNKMEDMLMKFGEIESKLANMENISRKIDDLEVQIKKRNPTPVEKLEMRSINSYPYNLKLTDYWADKADNYSIGDDTQDEEEYTLTQNDINNDYNEQQVKKSFDDEDENITFKY